MTYKQCQKKENAGRKKGNIFSSGGSEIFWHFWMCLFYCEPNKPASNLQQHDATAWNDSGGCLNFYFLLIYFTGQLRLQLWMMKIGPWWHWAALYGTEVLPSGWHFWYSREILFRASSSVLSPGKAISPSVWTIIPAVFILFLFVLRGLLNITSVCVTQRLQDAVKPAHALAAPRANFAFPFLWN